MKTIVGQVLSSTHLDRQGERNSKDVLKHFASFYAGRRLPLNQHHNLALPVVGYIENLHVVPDGKGANDWYLIGDVFLEREDTDMHFGGFSFSYMEKLRRSEKQESIEVFLPYPHYNDSALVDEVFDDGYVSVGKIVRKEVSPEVIALIVSVAVAVLQPFWEDVFRFKIAPSVSDFFQNRFGDLSKRRISGDLLQHIDYNGHNADVLFIPVRGREAECFSIGKLCAGMLLVNEYLQSLEVNHVPVSKVILMFNKREDRFLLNAVHLSNGHVKTDV